ncbi:MAG: succinate dehydrogenase cytochrome b subunit [Candidatus Riflebacteria bacterium]|nr:succinate dehydrogenase cytochrome b subunit [Candidatus Riflebacteria bacterium]
MELLQQYFQSSIGKKQIVALTGLMLIGFILGHLAGNLLIFKGPEALNAYAHKLASMRPAMYGVELALAGTFLLHICLTVYLFFYNNEARPIAYGYYQPTDRSISTRLMPYTGTLLAAFVIWHLLDFTFSDQTGTLSLVGKESLGLYGVVVNAFKIQWHSGLYILAMCAIGFHLTHGFQSFMQSLGLNHPKYTPVIKIISVFLGLAVAAIFSSIPLYVMFFARIP